MDTLLVSSSPHIRDEKNTKNIMADVLIALAPCVVAGVMFFGLRVLLLTATTTAAAVLTEYLSRLIMKRPQTAGDLSAAVTGLIVGLILPPQCNLFVAAFGSVAAIAVVKQMFGGLGQNFANPAATARVILLLSFPAVAVFTNTVFMPDAITSATPLAAGSGAFPYLNLFVGNTGGCAGKPACWPYLSVSYICLCEK